MVLILLNLFLVSISGVLFRTSFNPSAHGKSEINISDESYFFVENKLNSTLDL
jgi:hypothetical protein